MCQRFAICLCLVLVSSVTYAQDEAKPKRFKHEKHGAIVFATGDDYEIKCDIYQPIADEPRPIMLAIHGGAWTTGSKLAMFRHARMLANRGYVVMAINYRLAPKYKWPAQIHDCKQAVRWIREHASKYNGDPERVYAFGYSAGGHLAAMLATTDSDDGYEGEVEEPYSNHSSRISGLIAGGSPMEFSWILDDSTTLKYWLGATKEDNPEVYDRASPVTFLTADDPVCVVYHGHVDNLVPTSSPEAFVKRCGETKVDAELIISTGGHAAAFTWTTDFLLCLAKLEAKLSKKKCLEEIDAIVELVKAFIKSNRHFPSDLTELEKFAEQERSVKPADFKQMMFNDRDAKNFEISWTSQIGVIVSEAEGVESEKLSNRN